MNFANDARSTMLELPELQGQAQCSGLIRIPSELDVAVTRRVRLLLDTPAMHRLKSVSQLGLVERVYPGARHSRFEHSLGVYRLACRVLQHLMHQPAFASQVTPQDAKTFLITALVHDVGHWPYCHPIEDLRLPWIPRHEDLASQSICNGPLADVIHQQWGIDPTAVAGLLAASGPQAAAPYLYSLLSGPIDIDKMDYLQRDSLHAGVPYGRNFDEARLIGSLLASPGRDTIAISEKGKTAAEMMVFARYVMFSEVYWHHAVRSATAMLQRVVYELSRQDQTEVAAPHTATQNSSNTGGKLNAAATPTVTRATVTRGQADLATRWLQMSDSDFENSLIDWSRGQESVHALVDGLFGTQRRLYKRLAQFNFVENAEVHSGFARRPYSQLVRASELLAERLGRKLGQALQATDVLIDAPPVKLEVQFRLDVQQAAKQGDTPRFTDLGRISPVVKALATEQFDNFVKRVRVYIHPRLSQVIDLPQALIVDLLLEVAQELDS